MCREIAKEETLDCFFVPSPAGNTCFSLLSACHFAPFFESSITVDFHIGEQDSRFLLKNQIFSVECPKLFPCVSLFGKFFSTWRITSFSALPTPHTAIFSLKIDTQRSLEGGPCAGHMEPTLIFPSGSRRGRAKYDSTKKSRTAGVRSSLRGVSYVSRSAISRPQSAVFDRDFER